MVPSAKVKPALLIHGVVDPGQFRGLGPGALKGVIKEAIVGSVAGTEKVSQPEGYESQAFLSQVGAFNKQGRPIGLCAHYCGPQLSTLRTIDCPRILLPRRLFSKRILLTSMGMGTKACLKNSGWIKLTFRVKGHPLACPAG